MNPNFDGQDFYTIDSKNRLSIPSRMRDFIFRNEKMVLSRGLEMCLTLSSQEGWRKLIEKLDALPMKDPFQKRAFKRMLFRNACVVDFDEEGRILIPRSLLVYARLRKEAAILWLGEKIEIWARERWMDYEKKYQRPFLTHANRVEI